MIKWIGSVDDLEHIAAAVAGPHSLGMRRLLIVYARKDPFYLFRLEFLNDCRLTIVSSTIFWLSLKVCPWYLNVVPEILLTNPPVRFNSAHRKVQMPDGLTQSNMFQNLAHRKFHIKTHWPTMCPGSARKWCDCNHENTKAPQSIYAGLDCLHMALPV